MQSLPLMKRYQHLTNQRLQLDVLNVRIVMGRIIGALLRAGIDYLLISTQNFIYWPRVLGTPIISLEQL